MTTSNGQVAAGKQALTGAATVRKFRFRGRTLVVPARGLGGTIPRRAG